MSRINHKAMEHSDYSTAIGTMGGTVFTVIGNIQSSDLVKTVTLAIVGATVSFALSMLLKWTAKKFFRQRG